MDQLSTLLGDGDLATTIEIIISFVLGAATGFKVATKQRIKQVQKGAKHMTNNKLVASSLINQTQVGKGKTLNQQIGVVNYIVGMDEKRLKDLVDIKVAEVLACRHDISNGTYQKQLIDLSQKLDIINQRLEELERIQTDKVEIIVPVVQLINNQYYTFPKKR